MSEKAVGLRQGLGVLFVAASVIQGSNRKLFQALVPKSVAKHNDTIQTVAQISLAGIGVSFLIPRLRLVARVAATALLVGTLPSAVQQVQDLDRMKELGLPPQLVIGRIPVQIAVAVATWVATRKPTSD